MKLGNTREEMQKNYSEAIRKSRKVGKIMAMIGGISSVISIFWLMDLLRTDAPFGNEHLLFISFIFFCPIGGYIAGHMYYYGFRRMSSWLESISEGNVDGSGCLCFLLAFGGLGTMIAYIACISLFFSLGLYVGLYDWIKIHIDGKKYRLKVRKE